MTPLPKLTASVLTREDMVRILDLPAKEFRAARASMTEAEREELRRVWQEESALAIADYNRHVEEHGLMLARHRPF